LVRADSSWPNGVDREQQRLIFVSEPVGVRYPDDAPAQHSLISHYVDTGDDTAGRSATSAEPT